MIATLVGSLFSVVLPVPKSSYALHENVTVNVSGDDVTDTYEPGDSIAFVGTISDVVDNEEVSIAIKRPNGNTATSTVAEPDEDDGYFDYVYNIPNNAEDGVWTVEAGYDGDEGFTYFLVDDEEDAIIVELNNPDGLYEAGDEVEITGQVEDVDNAEPEVLITVLDPTNDEIFDEEPVELDGDEFNFSFDLDDDAPHGRYAVIVTYDANDQEGSVIFEIEDEDEGSSGGSGASGGSSNGDSDSDGDLSAEIDEGTYEPGDTVTIMGIIENYDDSEELEIIIEDPEGEEIESEDNVNVEEDGTDGEFKFEYDLDDNADEGTYTVIITYDASKVELEFEVEDGGSGDGSSTSTLTVKLNKSTYQAGEAMTVTGTVKDVADPEEEEQVSIFMYRSTGEVILEAGSSKYVTPSSSGTYSATIYVPSSLEEGSGYRVIVSYLGDQVETTFSVAGVSSNPSDELTVETDDDQYEIGSTVAISGDIPSSLIVPGQQLLIRIDKPDGNPCRIDQVEVSSSGSYEYELVLGGVCGEPGEYDVEVIYGSLESSTTFQLIGRSVAEYRLNVDGDVYPIEYKLSSGTINNMFLRTSEDKLVINVGAPERGQLTISLPREVIDSIEDGEDVEYVVTIEDQAGNIIIADAEETENTDEVRTLVIDYPAGSARIEIQGTQVVPEFNTIAAIVLAVAIVGIIVATSRYSKLSQFRQ
ncbi:MAG TPA: PEFG-CTERM sorting domain-containing protein [Nitrososphaera sp.]|nr:PEFG-CTERM sorting domain-containing protein [Nitrososphaera sp.]